MEIRRDSVGHFYVVFPNNVEADRFEWLFGKLLGLRRYCFGGYDNAYGS